MRETEKTIELEVNGNKKTFMLKKMNALAGSCLIKFCAEKLLPVYNGLQEIFVPAEDGEKEEEVARRRTEQLIQMIPQALSKLSDDEMVDFEMRCLKTVSVLYPAGWQPVIIGNSFGDEDVEYDIGSTLRLVYEVLAYNLGSFFGEGSSLSFLNRQNSSLPNV